MDVYAESDLRAGLRDAPEAGQNLIPINALALHAGRERVDPIGQRAFGAFSSKDQTVFREYLVRFIAAFEAE